MVLSGLGSSTEACREVPVAGYRAVGAAAQIDAARPSADIVGAQTRLRVDMPVRGVLKRYCTSALMSTEQNFLQMAMMLTRYAPVDCGCSVRWPDAEDGAVGTVLV